MLKKRDDPFSMQMLNMNNNFGMSEQESENASSNLSP